MMFDNRKSLIQVEISAWTPASVHQEALLLCARAREANEK